MDQTGPHLHRKRLLVGPREARHVGVAGRVHGDALAEIVHAPPDVAAVDQAGALRIHLGHEHVLDAVEGRVGTHLHRKGLLAGTRPPGHVGVAGRVHGDTVGPVGPAPADVAAVNKQGRVDDQGPRAVVGAHGKTEAGRIVRVQGVGRGHAHPFAFDLLVRLGRSILDTPLRGLRPDGSGLLDPDPGRPPVAQPDYSGIDSWIDPELVLQPVPRCLVDQVDARPQVLVDHPGEGRQPGLPVLLRPLEVADHGLLPVLAFGQDIRIRPDEIELHPPGAVFPLQPEHDPVPGEEQGLVRALDVELHRIRKHTFILDEVDREPAEGGFCEPHLLGIHPGGQKKHECHNRVDPFHGNLLEGVTGYLEP